MNPRTHPNMSGDIQSVIDMHKPSVGQVFVNDQVETFSPSNLTYSLNLGWTYQ